MDEAEICENVAIIDNGKIVAYGSPMELKEKLAYSLVRFKPEDIDEAHGYINDNYGHEAIVTNGDTIEVHIADVPTPFVADFIKKYDGKIENLEINRPTLNDVFMNITGRDIRENRRA